MKKICFSFVVLAVTLTGCATQDTAYYDRRPENKKPKLERPAWPNYDIDKTNSFAIFTDVQTVSHSQGTPILSSGRYTLYRCPEATYLGFDYPFFQDNVFFRFSSGTMLIDADTGDRYMIRELEHFPMDQCFWINAKQKQWVRLVMVFPPLPPKVKRIRLFEAGGQSRKWFENTAAEESRTLKVSKLRPQRNHSGKPQHTYSGKMGRIIY